jgi:Eco29kI restriction endonuclease
MSKSRRHSPQVNVLEAIKKHLAELEHLVPSLSTHAARRTRAVIDDLRAQLLRTYGLLDPIKEPATIFDPSDPETAGRLVALALLAQPRVPLDRIARAYGAGVYAIYYRGKHPYYQPISGTETPIYVGKADPKTSHARTARDQGERLYGRLRDHRKVIKQAEKYSKENGLPNPLHITDFECRRLTTATNAQLVAERYLIRVFSPVWNSDTKVCWGISKHGDQEGRSNDRSPWFVVHPTAYWALQKTLEDARPRERIIEDIAQHFKQTRIFAKRDDIVEQFFASFAQDPMLATAPVDDDAESNENQQEAE